VTIVTYEKGDNLLYTLRAGKAPFHDIMQFMTVALTEHNNLNDKKREYFFRLSLKLREALRLHKEAGLWARVGNAERDWGNVTEHCLVEVARVGVLADMLGLSHEMRDKLLRAAALHDVHKKTEKDMMNKAATNGGSVWTAYDEAASISTQNLHDVGIDPVTVRLAGAAGHGVLHEVEHMLDAPELSEEDIAFLALHYIDDITMGTDWVAPAQVREDGTLQNALDFKMGEGNEGRIKPGSTYDLLNQAGSDHFGGDTTWRHELVVGRRVEEKLASLINAQTPQLSIDPMRLPEIIDNGIRDAIDKI